MRLAVTADLHWGLSRAGDAATEALAAAVQAWSPDAFAIAGDVGEGPDFGACLARFAGVPGVRLVVPGNHDLWLRTGFRESLVRYERELPRIAAEHDFQYLDLAPYTPPGSDLAILGSMNWYDYSFADPELEKRWPEAQILYRRKRFPRGIHRDGECVRLGLSDSEFTGRLVARLKRQLAELPATVRRIVLIQHHPPVSELFYPTEITDPEQRFWLAYTGNRRMDALVRSDPRITWILCGHVHRYCAATVNGRPARNIGGDYDWKHLLLLDTETGEETWQEFPPRKG